MHCFVCGDLDFLLIDNIDRETITQEDFLAFVGMLWIYKRKKVKESVNDGC